MITLSEALKIAERHEHAKMYKYSESEEEYVFPQLNREKSVMDINLP